MSRRNEETLYFDLTENTVFRFAAVKNTEVIITVCITEIPSGLELLREGTVIKRTDSAVLRIKIACAKGLHNFSVRTPFPVGADATVFGCVSGV
jgi:hypothetical protein